MTVGGLILAGTTLNYELNASDHTAGSLINDLIDVNGLLDLTGGATLNVTAGEAFRSVLTTSSSTIRSPVFRRTLRWVRFRCSGSSASIALMGTV